MRPHTRLEAHSKFLFRCAIVSLPLVGGVLIVLSEIMAGHVSLSRIAQNLLLHMGVAALVAFFLAVTVDVYLRSEFGRSVSRSVFEAIFRQIVPSEIVDEVVQNIVHQPVLRMNQHVDLSLRRTNTSGILMATYSFRYELINLTGHNQPITIAHDFMRPPMKGFEEQVYFEEINISSPKQNHHFSGLSLDDHVRRGKTNIRFSAEIVLGPREKASVNGVAKQAVMDHDSGPWFVRQPTINFSVQYDHDEDLVAQVIAAHPAAPARLKRLSPKQWVLQGGILPFQGIIFSWHPKQGDVEKL